MLDIKISTMELIERKPGGGSPVVATFSINIGPLRISDCAIFEHDDGTLAASIPRSRAGGKLVKFREHEDYAKFQSVALAAYAGMMSSNEPQEEPDDAGLRRVVKSEWVTAKGVGS
ncbi:hypothetical protein ACK6D9_11630 [Hoeflea sp. Naph1]|uniref:hypothetical protein n=1 Tax=Hoeflea sp. Naph1 TaxID=3388653 RepID=UPI00398FDF60